MIRTTEIAPGLAIAAQPEPSDIAGLAETGFKTLINNRPDGEEPAQMPMAVGRDKAKRHGLAYVYIPVTSSTITTADVAAFERALEASPKPIVAHCRSGTRTYLLWATGQALGGKADPAKLVADAAAKGYDIKSLPDLETRLKAR